MEIPSQMNERIRFLRESKKYTQQEIADKLGVGRAVYGMYEGGTRSVSVEVIVKLAQLYGVSTDFLLGLSNNTKDNSSSVESYLNDGAVKTITKMGNSSDKKALAALNTLLSDSQCYKIFTSLYKALFMPRRGIYNNLTKNMQDLSEIEAETKAYIKDLLGLSEITPDYSDVILEKIASEIGINTKSISKEAHNVAKMLFMTQMENFIEQNLSFKSERTRANKNIRKSLLNEE